MVSQNASAIFLTVVYFYAQAFFVISMEELYENITTPNFYTKSNDTFSHRTYHSKLLKHPFTKNKIPSSNENSFALISVDFVGGNQNDKFISRSIRTVKDKKNPVFKKTTGSSGSCDTQYQCGTSNVRSIKSFIMCRNGIEICTRISHILKHLDSYKCGRCDQAQNCQLQFARNLQKSHDNSALGVATLKTNKLSYYQGGDITFTFSISADQTIGITDWIKIVYANVTENYNHAKTISSTYLYESYGFTNGTKSMYIYGNPGNYKAVMFSYHMGPVRAISNTFKVLQPTGNLFMSSESYSQGETIYLLAFDFTVSLRDGDFIRIIPANVSKNYHDAPSATYSKIGEFSGSRNSVIPFFANWTVGRYKAVLFLQESKIVVAVSNVFELSQLPVVVSTNKPTYYHGEDIVVKFNNTRGVTFKEYDQVGIVFSNVTNNFESAKFIRMKNLFGASGLTKGNVSFYANMSVAGEKLRAVFLLKDSYIGSLSQVFEVKTNQIQLNTTKTAYYQGGEDIHLIIKSLSGVKFRYFDLIKIIPSNITNDYYNTPHVYSGYVNGVSDFSYNMSISVDWKIGKYKAVFFLEYNTNVQAVSNEFNILQNKIQLKSSETTYNQSETLVLKIESISGIPFGYWDVVKIITANITKDYYNAPYVSMEYITDASGQTSRNMSIHIHWNFGTYKAVFFLEDFTDASVVSNDFNILQNKIQLNSSKTTYYQSGNLELQFSSISGVPFRGGDFVRIILATITEDFYNTPYVNMEYIFGASGLISGDRSVFVNWNIGKYKAVFFLEGYTDASAVSNEFDILPNIIQLKSSKKTYYQNETMVLTISTISGDPLRYWDAIKILAANITENYINSPQVYFDYMYFDSGRTSVNKSIFINWNVGEYKAVFFLAGYYDALAVSNEFNIVVN